MLKEKTGAFYPIINFVGIHMVPTLVVYGCILPAVYAVRCGLSANVFSVIAILVSLGAATLQGAADIEMHRYRKNRTGSFIRVGLWKYSRHPNYLGEIVMWWGIALSAVAVLGFKWYYIVGALFNTLLFFCVSIPLAEGRQRKKEGFAEYKMRTRVLLPIRK
jgi:steroid 5-alpha reductase family enzyme